MVIKSKAYLQNIGKLVINIMEMNHASIKRDSIKLIKIFNRLEL